MNNYCLPNKIFQALAGHRTGDNGASPGPEARTVKNIVLLVVADRLLHPENHGECGRWSKRDVAAMMARNAPLMQVFSCFFKEIASEWENHARTVAKINDCLQDVRDDELLHIPGQVHEFMIGSACAGAFAPAEGCSARKKQGSYYTPSYIVRYMVEQSLNYLADSAGEHRLRSFKALDPACGGASFPVEICRQLLRWGLSGQEALESVYGTDIDEEAVDLSIFVLTVAVLAADPQNLGADQIKLQLQKQFKTGNALAAPDKVISGGINWGEMFPSVFGTGISRDQKGFDLVIGNPPYISNKLIPADEKRYYRENYLSARRQFDLSVPFLEQGVNLLKKKGLLCYITSNKFLAADYGKSLRQEILHKNRLIKLIDVSTIKAFENASAYPVIITVEKRKPAEGKNLVRIYRVDNWEELAESAPVEIDQDFFRGHSDYLITTQLNGEILPVINKIEGIRGRVPRKVIRCGLAETGFNKWVSKIPPESGTLYGGIYPFIRAGHIKPYKIINHDYIDTRHINSADREEFQGPKLVIPGIAKKLKAAVDYSDSVLGRVYFIRETETELDLRYLGVLFNSMVLNFYYRVMYWPVHLSGGYLRFNSTYIANIPVYSGQAGPSLVKKKLVSDIITLGQQLLDDCAGREKQPSKETELAVCKAEALVFLLYGLDSKEADAVMKFMRINEQKRQEIKNLMEEG